MPHRRQIIRNTVVTMLSGLATTGSNVFPTRIYPVAAGQLPCLCVYTLSEESDSLAMGLGDRDYLRVLELQIEGITQANATFDDTLDAIATEVEIAMASNPLFANVRDSLLVRTTIARARDTEKETGSVLLTYRVEYDTRAIDPTTGA